LNSSEIPQSSRPAALRSFSNIEDLSVGRLATASLSGFLRRHAPLRQEIVLVVVLDTTPAVVSLIRASCPVGAHQRDMFLVNWVNHAQPTMG
jgi:hypothetical protein